VANSLTTSVTVVAGVLLVLYPLIDAVATLIDAPTQHGSARQWLLVNAGTSTVAAIALGVAATRSVVAVFMVIGVWAAVSGAAQLVVVLRRTGVGNQWPLLLANGASIIGGVAFFIAAAVGHPDAGHAGDLRRHRRHRVRHPGLATHPAPPPPGQRRGPPS
jgi:hypothetical protein